MNKIFYVTSDRISIKLRCVTPLCHITLFSNKKSVAFQSIAGYCNNSIQHKNHKSTVTQSLVSSCLRGSKSVTILQHEKLETWFEFETKDAIKNLSTSVATQGTMPLQQMLVTKK